MRNLTALIVGIVFGYVIVPKLMTIRAVREIAIYTERVNQTNE